MALAVRCHYIRAAFLVANDKYRGTINDKFNFFNTHFPDVLSKEEFRRKIKTFCGFVAKKNVCRGSVRKSYLDKYGPDVWNCMENSVKLEHQVLCTICTEDEMMPEATGHRPKKPQTTILCTPLGVKKLDSKKDKLSSKKTGRRTLKRLMKFMSDLTNDWESTYDTKLSQALRKVRLLNLTPRKSRSEKEKKNRAYARKVDSNKFALKI